MTGRKPCKQLTLDGDGCPGTLTYNRSMGIWVCDTCGYMEAEPDAMNDDFQVPDEIGEYVGFRAWYVLKSGPRLIRLASLMTVAPGAALWPPNRWTEAQCPHCMQGRAMRPVPRHDPQDVPNEACGCGIYVANNEARLKRLGYNRYRDSDRHPLVIGECGVAGKVIVADSGFRAQKARPIRLYVPHHRWKLVKPLEETYGVPVHVANILRRDE